MKLSLEMESNDTGPPAKSLLGGQFHKALGYIKNNRFPDRYIRIKGAQKINLDFRAENEKVVLTQHQEIFI
jgi:hypothetical protein